ncbi:MarR family winged helix-turn-helix transcriptional regulator [Aliivibrio kagoshimensis]|uniref:MarR family winged helix-turn-helix transcriptional regulator n=1 Tax=Aliivibrio kagoshimensis TaxID=2910230 RepID=UPI003D13E74C
MDALDRIKKQWARERPELNTLPMQILGRMGRIYKYSAGNISECHEKYGIKIGEFDVLATLLRSGEPYQLTPSELLTQLMLTSGAMTNRMTRLEEKGLIERSHSVEDRRSVMVKLTIEGRLLINTALTEHVVKQQQITSSLTEEEQQQMNHLLTKWLKEWE